jgi:hypothetical protein
MTELEENSLETSEYRNWMENTLGKITPKNDQFFKKTEGKIKEEHFQTDKTIQMPERDCLIEEHQK